MTNEKTLKSFADLARALSDTSVTYEPSSEKNSTKTKKRKQKKKITTKPNAPPKPDPKEKTKIRKGQVKIKVSKSYTSKSVMALHEAQSKSKNKNHVTPVSTIKPDRSSLYEFDKRLAAGPQLPDGHPDKRDVEQLYMVEPEAALKFGHGINSIADRSDVILGLDVGSTATKMVLRLPFSEDVGLPVPAPTWFRAEGHPYYWRTLLWKSQSGIYSIEPFEGAVPIDRLKVDLFELGSGDRRSIKSAMVAWVVLMARQALRWLRAVRPSLFMSGTVVVEEINLGMPFTKVSEASADQTQVASAAGYILETGAPVTETAIDQAFEAIDTQGSELVSLQPELAGALHGFLRSHQRRDGRYLLADIGGLTVDTVFFGFREDAKPPISVYAKSVECFGSDVIAKWCEQVGTHHRATKVLGNHVAEVAKTALQEKISLSPEARSKPFELEVILIGGGRHSEPHQASIEWCENSMRRHAPPLDLRLRELAPDRDDLDIQLGLDLPIDRLLIAMGLSYSRYDMPDIRPPSEMANVERVHARDVFERFVGPEQC